MIIKWSNLSKKFSKLLTGICLVVLPATHCLFAGEIHDAAAAGDMNKVKSLLETDLTLLESKDEDGNTPLISACWGPPSNLPQVEVANFLINKGANIHAQNYSGATPLYFSVKNFDLIQRLINMGADVNVKAYGGLTPIFQAAFSGNLKVAKLLADHGADLNVRSQEGTILHRIINKRNSTVEMVKLLVENGAKLQEFSFGNTELHLAVLKGSKEVVRILIELGADVNAVNDYGHTALYYAARHGYRSIADVMIAAGADESTIVEANYGKATHLTKDIRQGEAYLWYMGDNTSPYIGYAVKTKDHLLVFNPSGINDSPEAGIANGYLNPNELAGQKITALILYRQYQGQLVQPTIFDLSKRLKGINIVQNFKPTTDSSGISETQQYHLAIPRECFSVDGIKVYTIPAVGKVWFSDEGLGYLVEVDGVKIFHAGLHVTGNSSPDIEKYQKEIDFLKPFGPIDIVILPINGRHFWWIDYESYFYLIDQLLPKAVYLIGDDLATEEHLKCIEVLKARDVPVFYPEGGIAVGERFHYPSNKK